MTVFLLVTCLLITSANGQFFPGMFGNHPFGIPFMPFPGYGATSINDDCISCNFNPNVISPREKHYCCSLGFLRCCAEPASSLTFPEDRSRFGYPVSAAVIPPPREPGFVFIQRPGPAYEIAPSMAPVVMPSSPVAAPMSPTPTAMNVVQPMSVTTKPVQLKMTDQLPAMLSNMTMRS